MYAFIQVPDLDRLSKSPSNEQKMLRISGEQREGIQRMRGRSQSASISIDQYYVRSDKTYQPIDVAIVGADSWWKLTDFFPMFKSGISSAATCNGNIQAIFAPHWTKQRNFLSSTLGTVTSLLLRHILRKHVLVSLKLLDSMAQVTSKCQVAVRWQSIIGNKQQSSTSDWRKPSLNTNWFFGETERTLFDGRKNK